MNDRHPIHLLESQIKVDKATLGDLHRTQKLVTALLDSLLCSSDDIEPNSLWIVLKVHHQSKEHGFVTNELVMGNENHIPESIPLKPEHIQALKSLLLNIQEDAEAQILRITHKYENLVSTIKDTSDTL